MRKTGWRKLTAMLTALLMMLNTVPLGALADEIFGSTPDSESSGQNLWTEQDLYNVAMVNSAWYRLAKTKIIAKTVESYNVDASLQPDEYTADAYPFKDLVINYKGVEYHYRADGGARDPEVNYYTVSLEKPNTPILVKTRIGGAAGYLVPSDQQYGTIDSFPHFHRGYKIDLDKASDRRYTVRFLTWDGKNIQTFNRLEYGKKVQFSGVTPTRNQTTDKVYTFSGWNPEITDPDGTVTVTGDADYTAVFEEKARTYEITWKDETGAVIKKTQVPYGDTPSFDYNTQDYHSHDEDNYTYTFEKWNPDPVPVTGNATYRAVVSKEAKTSAQDLFIMVRTEGPGNNGNKYYRFDRLTGGITTTNAAIVKKGATLDPSTYELNFVPDDYFGNIVFRVKGVDYIYSAKELSGEHDAYYTIAFDRVLLHDRINDDPSWFADESGWAGNSKTTYQGASNNTSGFHADYVATLHPSTMPFYSVTFVNEDRTVLKEATQYKKGTKAQDIVKPDKPTKAEDDQYTYTFAGWDPDVTDVAGDVTYTAKYTSTQKGCTITFVNEDDTELQSGIVAYGETPVYTGDTPTKAEDAQYTYTFYEWTPEITEVTGDTTYTATYTSTVKEYTVSFVNDDETVLQSQSLSYGATPEYKGETPEKSEDQYYTYSFKGWSPEISTVTGETTYMAQYDATIKDQPLYNMAKVGNNWYRLERTTIHAQRPVEDYVVGVTVEGNQKPVPEDEYTIEDYHFSGMKITIDNVTYQYWDGKAETKPDNYTNYFTVGYEKENEKVVASLKKISSSNLWLVPEEEWPDSKTTSFKRNFVFALHKATGKYYTVRFLNDDGTVLQTNDHMKAGEIPAYTGNTPTKAEDEQFTYTFAGWTPAIAAVANDVTYTATYTSTFKKYTVTFVNEDDVMISAKAYDYGTEIAKIEVPEAPAKTGYSFTSWKTIPQTVTEDVTVTPVYAINQYTITFDSNGGGEVVPITQDYGTAVTAPADPTREGYTFAGWDAAVPATMPAQNLTLTAQWKIDDSLKIIAYTDWPEGRMGFPGAVVNLSSELIGFENKEYTLQWQHSLDGTTWIDEPGANEDTYTFVLDEQNARYIWRIIAIDIKNKE